MSGVSTPRCIVLTKQPSLSRHQIPPKSTDPPLSIYFYQGYTVQVDFTSARDARPSFESDPAVITRGSGASVNSPVPARTAIHRVAGPKHKDDKQTVKRPPSITTADKQR